MEEGFKAFLDDADFSLGAIEEPQDDEEPGEIHVTLKNGTTRTVHAIGVDEVAGTTVLHGFNWVSYNENRIRELADQHGMTFEEAVGSADLDGKFVMLEFSSPWENVLLAQTETDGVVQ